jgi:hypothetical protein
MVVTVSKEFDGADGIPNFRFPKTKKKKQKKNETISKEEKINTKDKHLLSI